MVETFDQEKLISRSYSNYLRFSFLLQFAKTEFFGTPEILELKYSDKKKEIKLIQPWIHGRIRIQTGLVVLATTWISTLLDTGEILTLFRPFLAIFEL